ncbi:hypothetical protein KKD03_03865, partial [Patescibacteria group bacterium]|nr:hypothetical protein [Patescibacteria group bacterium]
MQIGNVPSSEVKHIWDQACAQLQIQLSPAVYNTWIVSNPVSTLDYLEDSKCLATIMSPTAFHSTNLKKNLHLQIKQSLDKATGKNCEIQYVVGSIVFSPATNRMNKARQSGFST